MLKMVSGKRIRLSRITKNGRMLCIPMDHGVSIGPINGLDSISETIGKIQEGGASSVLVHKGIIRSLKWTPNLGLIVHASVSTDIGPSPNRKILVSNVKEAVRMGADAISLHINIGADDEPEMLADLGAVADEADEWNLPLIGMMYPRGKGIKNPNDPKTVAHVTRIGAELGADIVKTVYTGDPDSFRTVVDSCPVPVVIAGGPRAKTDRDALNMARAAIDSGAIGVTFGRNVFQYKNTKAMVAALAKIVYDDASVDDALEEFNDG